MSSYHASLLSFQEEYDHNVSQGKTQPLLVPQHLAGTLILFVWLMLTPYHARLPWIATPVAFTAVVALSVLTLVSCRSLGLAFGFGIGAQSVMTVVLAINLMLLHDPRNFSRLMLERRVGGRAQDQINIEAPSGANTKATKYDIRRMHFSQKYDVVWQKAPNNALTRAGWVLDLLISLRGFHWCWTDANMSHHQYMARDSARLPRKARSILQNALVLITSYVCLDCIKTLMIYDPYFWGQIQAGPPHYLPSLLKAQTPLQIYRMFITFLAILSAIIYLSAVCHIVIFSILSSPRYGFLGGGWLCLPLNGSIDSVARSGLKGFWGEWWHQLLRRHCCSLGDAVADLCGFKMPSDYRKATRYIVAFFLSGILHACGSYTLAGSTRPWASFVPFALQPIGIFIEATAGRYLSLVIPRMASSGFWRTVGHLGFTLSWLVLTFSFLMDDLAKSGIWFIEPLPFSPLRWTGISGEKGLWYCWRGPWLSFYKGRSVWESGFAVNGPR